MENKTFSLLKLSGASPERRMSWLFRLVVALAIMVLAPQGAKAWSNLYLIGWNTGNDTWVGTSGTQLTKADTDGNKYTGTIKPTASTIYFELWNSSVDTYGDNKSVDKYWGGGSADFSGSSVSVTTDGETYEGSSGDTSHQITVNGLTSGTTYDITAEASYSNDKTYWKITISEQSSSTTKSYYLVGNFTSWATNDSYKLSDTELTQTFSYTGSELYTAAGNSTTIEFKLEDSGSTWLNPSSTNVTEGTALTFSSSNSDNGNAKLTIENNASKTYTFTFTRTSTDNGWESCSLTVTSSTSTTPAFYFSGNFNSWAADSKYKLSDTETSQSFTISGSDLYTGAGSTTIELVVKETTYNYAVKPANGAGKITLGTAKTFSSKYNNNGVNATLTVENSSTAQYTFTFARTSTDDGWNDLTLTVTATGVSEEGHYLCIKVDGQDDNTAVVYKMDPSRSRNGGTISETMFTKNLKADELKTALNLSNYSSQTLQAWVVEANSNTASPILTGDDLTNYKYTTVTLSEKHSYTWYWDDNHSDASVNKTWRVVDNTGTVSSSTSDAFNAGEDYYIIGNFTSAKSDVQIDPLYDANILKLERYVYSGGKATKSDYTNYSSDGSASADSIVYRVTVPQPTEGWGNLFFAIAPASLITNQTDKSWQYSVDASGYYKNWFSVIRPQVQTYNRENDNDGYSGMDATALSGGLFKGNGNDASKSGWPCLDENNRSQAINPDVSAHSDATSYIFSMNVTYHTYRISFSDDVVENSDTYMYLVGPAVDVVNTKGSTSQLDANGATKTVTATNGTGDGTTTATVDAWMGSGLQLTYDATNQCYKYVVDGVETPIRMLTDKAFRFVTGKNFENIWYGEDSNVPATINSLGSDYNLTGSYSSTGKNDTQFLNTLYTADKGETENLIADESKNITWGLKNRGDSYTENYIRLYTKKIGTETRTFYTVLRKVSFHKFSQKYKPSTALSTSSDGYQYWRSWSDFNANRVVADPSNTSATTPEVGIYIVTSYNTHTTSKTTSQIGSTEIADITTGKYDDKTLSVIPANCGVVLGTNGDFLTSANYYQVWLETFPENPNYTLAQYNTNNSTSYDSKLTTAMGANEIKSYTNTMFPFGEINNSTVGFYYAASGATTTQNDAYLEYSGGGAKSYLPGQLAFSFGWLDDNQATGINGVETESANANEPYYTLSGVRLVSKPNAPGVYVKGGKKVVIK